MSEHDQLDEPSRGNVPARLPLLSLLLLLPVLPPETRGLSLAGGAALLALLALLGFGSGRRGGAGALLTCCAIAAGIGLAAPAPAVAVRPLVVLLLGLAGALSLRSLGARAGSMRHAVGALSVAAAVVSLHAVEQRLFGLARLAERIAADPSAPDRSDMLGRLATGRAFAAFPTPAALGGFLALAFPATVGLAWGSRGRSRWVWAGIGVVELGGLLSAASLTAVGALVGAGLLTIGVRRMPRKGLIAAGAVGLALAAAIVGLRGDEVLSPGHENSPWRLRAGNFRAAAGIVVERPWLGVGPGGFADAFPAHRREGDNETRHVHDLPLEMTAEYGLPVGVALSAIFAVLFLGPVLRPSPEQPPWRRGVAIGLAAFAVHNLADFTAYLPSIFWCAALLRGRLAEDADDGLEAPAAGPARTVLARGAALALALAAIGSGVADDRRHEARLAAWHGEAEDAERLARSAVRWAPWDADAALDLVRASAARPPLAHADPGRLAEVAERADAAVRLAPGRAGARATRAQVRVARGDLGGALADLTRAVELRPLHDPYHRDLATLRGVLRERLTALEARP